MQLNIHLSILNDFSEYPKLRYCSLSEDSAEKFYHEKLNAAFEDAYSKKIILVVNIDYTAGYTSSFLDEAFGNLVYDFGLNLVKDFLKIISEDEPYWIDMIANETFPQWEERRKKGQEPKKTCIHSPWVRIINNISEKKIWNYV